MGLDDYAMERSASDTEDWFTVRVELSDFSNGVGTRRRVIIEEDNVHATTAKAALDFVMARHPAAIRSLPVIELSVRSTTW